MPQSKLAPHDPRPQQHGRPCGRRPHAPWSPPRGEIRRIRAGGTARQSLSPTPPPPPPELPCGPWLAGGFVWWAPLTWESLGVRGGRLPRQRAAPPRAGWLPPLLGVNKATLTARHPSPRPTPARRLPRPRGWLSKDSSSKHTRALGTFTHTELYQQELIKLHLRHVGRVGGTPGAAVTCASRGHWLGTRSPESGSPTGCPPTNERRGAKHGAGHSIFSFEKSSILFINEFSSAKS